VAVGRRIGGCLTGDFPHSLLPNGFWTYSMFFGFWTEFGLRGKFLGLPGGWTILDAAYRIGFLSVVS